MHTRDVWVGSTPPSAVWDRGGCTTRTGGPAGSPLGEGGRRKIPERVRLQKLMTLIIQWCHQNEDDVSLYENFSCVVWVTEVGGSGGGTTPVTYDLRTLYCECVITRGCNRGAAAGASEVSKLLGLSYTSYSPRTICFEPQHLVQGITDCTHVNVT